MAIYISVVSWPMAVYYPAPILMYSLTETAGNPVQSIAYAPFGETVFYNGIKDPKYQFTGQEFDTASGIYYYGARYYAPEIGRFLQADTVLDGLNRYTYCGNNPVNYVDPTGNEGVKIPPDISAPYQQNGNTYIDVTYQSVDGTTRTYRFEGDTLTYDTNGNISGSNYQYGHNRIGYNGPTSNGNNASSFNGTTSQKDSLAQWNENVTKFNNDLNSAVDYVWDHCANFDFGADFYHYAVQSWDNGNYLDWALWDINFMLEAMLDGLLCYGGVKGAATLISKVTLFLQQVKDAAGGAKVFEGTAASWENGATPNSIYVQLSNKGLTKTVTTYDNLGNAVLRTDFIQNTKHFITVNGNKINAANYIHQHAKMSFISPGGTMYLKNMIRIVDENLKPLSEWVNVK